LAGADTPRLDEGILIRQDDIAGRGFEFGSAVLFDLADGADPNAVISQFPDGIPDDVDSATEWFESTQPVELIQSGDAVDVLRLSIAVLLVAVMATVGHNLLGFVRERRGAFAVLKALGFTPRQIRATVLWQSGLLVVAALVVSVPLGIAVGRWLYQGFAGGIGVVVQPAVPVLALTAAVLGAAGLVQVVALVPARQARRTDAATALRPE
jgi:ABC-type lipoprotein release transport system permease subunit